jgi:hypothetical protein
LWERPWVEPVSAQLVRSLADRDRALHLRLGACFPTFGLRAVHRTNRAGDSGDRERRGAFPAAAETGQDGCGAEREGNPAKVLHRPTGRARR